MLSGYRVTINKNEIQIKDKSLFMGCIEHNKCGNYLIVPYTIWGDYHGSTVERANCKAFLDMFGELDGVYDVWGYYRSSYVLIKYELYENNEEIKNIINSLLNYPLISQDELSQLELEIENEDWEAWIKDSLKNKLEERILNIQKMIKN